MAVDLSALASAGLTATALSNLILVNPQKNVGYKPQLQSGTTGENEAESFLFDIEGENTTTLEFDITDHFVEDNTALQDQVAIKPVIIETEGFVGELTTVVPKVLQPVKTVADKLSVLDPFVPQLSATALIAYNEALLAYQTAQLIASAAVSAWTSIAGGTADPVQTKQQQAFKLFYGYAKSRQLFTVQTPWAVHKDMIIKTLRAVQDPETNQISTFNITFKEMRFASSITSLAGLVQQGRAVDQSSSVVDHGVSVPVPGASLSTQLNTAGLA